MADQSPGTESFCQDDIFMTFYENMKRLLYETF